MARAGWRTVFDATIADVRTAFTHRKDLIEQFPRPDDRVKGFAQWSHPLKEEAEIMENHSKNGMRGDADEVKERFRGLQAQALKELEAVRDEVKDGTVKTVANLRRSASPPPELRSLAVFHRRLTHRQAQLYGTTQRAFAEGRAF
ncbi:hypothetical protein JCM10213_001757 [Rhodosporidiobolus nylandii]